MLKTIIIILILLLGHSFYVGHIISQSFENLSNNYVKSSIAWFNPFSSNIVIPSIDLMIDDDASPIILENVTVETGFWNGVLMQPDIRALNIKTMHVSDNLTRNDIEKWLNQLKDNISRGVTSGSHHNFISETYIFLGDIQMMFNKFERDDTLFVINKTWRLKSYQNNEAYNFLTPLKLALFQAQDVLEQHISQIINSSRQQGKVSRDNKSFRRNNAVLNNQFLKTLNNLEQNNN